MVQHEKEVLKMNEFIMDALRNGLDSAAFVVLCSLVIGYLGYACHFKKDDIQQDGRRIIVAIGLLFVPSAYFWFAGTKVGFDWPLVGLTMFMGLLAYGGLQFGSKYQNFLITTACFMLIYVTGTATRHYIIEHTKTNDTTFTHKK
jgi:fucose 4-O-acetylase-like acetyltransferase